MVFFYSTPKIKNVRISTDACLFQEIRKKKPLSLASTYCMSSEVVIKKHIFHIVQTFLSQNGQNSMPE